MGKDPEPIAVEEVAVSAECEALQLVFSHYGSADRGRVIAELLASLRDLRPAGLFEARRGNRLVGAAWAQLQPGATGVVWPPGLVDQDSASVAAALLAACCDHFRRNRVALAQSLLDSPTAPQRTYLEAAEFVHLANLHYMASMRNHFPTAEPSSRLEFAAYRSDRHDRFARLVLKTYEETLDCPSLSGVRDIDDVLAGYQATGEFEAGLWLRVHEGSQDVGCLLLSDHPRSDHVELVYMGIVPEARGKGWGFELVRHAQWLAHRRGRSRVLLAVDANNPPAFEVYEQAGFVAWAQRSVFVRSFDAPIRV